ncbi:hypothetical protein SNEBB_003122 [Seison nebaliae]|nr:hypothetical protein SNEBB_003122 [Seison nebaliae]
MAGKHRSDKYDESSTWKKLYQLSFMTFNVFCTTSFFIIIGEVVIDYVSIQSYLCFAGGVFITFLYIINLLYTLQYGIRYGTYGVLWLTYGSKYALVIGFFNVTSICFVIIIIIHSIVAHINLLTCGQFKIMVTSISFSFDEDSIPSFIVTEPHWACGLLLLMVMFILVARIYRLSQGTITLFFIVVYVVLMSLLCHYYDHYGDPSVEEEDGDEKKNTNFIQGLTISMFSFYGYDSLFYHLPKNVKVKKNFLIYSLLGIVPLLIFGVIFICFDVYLTLTNIWQIVDSLTPISSIFYERIECGRIMHYFVDCTIIFHLLLSILFWLGQLNAIMINIKQVHKQISFKLGFKLMVGYTILLALVAVFVEYQTLLTFVVLTLLVTTTSVSTAAIKIIMARNNTLDAGEDKEKYVGKKTTRQPPKKQQTIQIYQSLGERGNIFKRCIRRILLTAFCMKILNFVWGVKRSVENPNQKETNTKRTRYNLDDYNFIAGTPKRKKNYSSSERMQTSKTKTNNNNNNRNRNNTDTADCEENSLISSIMEATADSFYSCLWRAYNNDKCNQSRLPKITYSFNNSNVINNNNNNKKNNKENDNQKTDKKKSHIKTYETMSLSGQIIVVTVIIFIVLLLGLSQYLKYYLDYTKTIIYLIMPSVILFILVVAILLYIKRINYVSKGDPRLSFFTLVPFTSVTIIAINTLLMVQISVIFLGMYIAIMFISYVITAYNTCEQNSKNAFEKLFQLNDDTSTLSDLSSNLSSVESLNEFTKDTNTRQQSSSKKAPPPPRQKSPPSTSSSSSSSSSSDQNNNSIVSTTIGRHKRRITKVIDNMDTSTNNNYTIANSRSMKSKEKTIWVETELRRHRDKNRTKEMKQITVPTKNNRTNENKISKRDYIKYKDLTVKDNQKFNISKIKKNCYLKKPRKENFVVKKKIVDEQSSNKIKPKTSILKIFPTRKNCKNKKIPKNSISFSKEMPTIKMSKSKIGKKHTATDTCSGLGITDLMEQIQQTNQTDIDNVQEKNNPNYIYLKTDLPIPSENNLSNSIISNNVEMTATSLSPFCVQDYSHLLSVHPSIITPNKQPAKHKIRSRILEIITDNKAEWENKTGSMPCGRKKIHNRRNDKKNRNEKKKKLKIIVSRAHNKSSEDDSVIIMKGKKKKNNILASDDTYKKELEMLESTSFRSHK